MTPTKRYVIGALAGLGIAAAAVAYLAYFASPREHSAADSASTDAARERYRVGRVEMAVGVEPRTPRVGENRLVIELTDPDGDPLTGIPIEAHAEMPAMGAMPAMRAPADIREVAPGRYEGTMNLSMRGSWPLTVRMQDPETGEEARVQFDLATDRPGLEVAAGARPVDGGETASAAASESGADDPAAAGDTSNAITVDSRRRQLIGLETGTAERRELVRPIRAVGEVAYDERLLSEVTLKFDGYIGDLKADYVGAPIEAGQELFTVYSPELLSAQQEYLAAVDRGRSTDGENVLLRAARQRLRLWDLTEAQIEALERRGVPTDYISIHAPRGGTLIERNITDGSAAMKGRTLLTIADLSRVWVEAQVFEADLELVEEGMSTRVTLPYLPGRRFEGTVDYVYPYLTGETRTARVRVTLDNSTGVLKPGMYAEVSLQASLGERLSVPEEAVLVAGQTRVVFVDLGDGRLNPVRIETGRRAQGYVEVLDGLASGDRVVTSGNFLIAAETRLKTGLDQW